jgi:hypothetical protein
MNARASYLLRVYGQKPRFDLELQYVSGSSVASVARVLVTGNLHGVAFFKDRIEDRLLGKTRRKRAPTGLC